MKWYSPIGCDNTRAAPFVGDECDLGIHDEYEFRRCRSIADWTGTAWLKAGPCGRDGDPDDVLQSALVLPIYSKRLREALESGGVQGIQYLPISVFRSDGRAIGDFSIANILNCRGVLDLSRSDYTRYADDYVIPTRRGQISILNKIVLNAEELVGVDVFRLAEYRVCVIVSERFVDIFEKRKFTGYSFSELET